MVKQLPAYISDLYEFITQIWKFREQEGLANKDLIPYPISLFPDEKRHSVSNVLL